MPKPFVFLSYCQKDAVWRDEIVEELLQPCKQQGLLDFWYDQKLEAGVEHEVEILDNLARADVAIFLVSPRFVGSWFIQNEELPRVLQARKEGRMRILWLLLKPLDLDLVKDLKALQAGENPSKPLNGMTEYERGRVYEKVTKQLREWAKEPAPAAATPHLEAERRVPAAETPTREDMRDRHRDAQQAITLVTGDLARETADAIIVSASATFKADGGIEKAIHAAAGPELRATLSGRRLGVAEACTTPAFALQARHLVHAVAPNWRGNPSNDLALLHRTYDRAFDAAIEAGARTIALGSFGTGHKRFPAEVTASIAIEAAQRAIDRAPQDLAIRFVLQDPAVLAAFQEELAPPVAARGEGRRR